MIPENRFDTLKDNLLLTANSDDFIGLWQIDGHAFRVGYADDDERVDAVLRVIREVIDRGWAIAGDMGRPGVGLPHWDKAWTIDQIIEKIEKDWAALTKPLWPGDVVYLRLTFSGKKEAERAWEREQARRQMDKA